MTPESDGHTLFVGDCRAMLADLDADSIDGCVTDPPYGLSSPPDMAEVLRHWLAGDDYEHGGSGFMGKTWDSFVPGPATWRELYRVLKPGAHAVVFAGQRTVDLMGVALRLAGFEVRDLIGWQFYSGFPKSLDVSKAIDALHGAEPRGNHHPTVKPLRLIRWLMRLVTPPGGTMVEPFCGSGTGLLASQAEGFRCHAAEMNTEYHEIIRARYAGWARLGWPDQIPGDAKREMNDRENGVQSTIWEAMAPSDMMADA